MVAAAGLGSAVATEKSPVLRAPIVKPKPVSFDDGLAQGFDRIVRPGAVGFWISDSIGQRAKSGLARKRQRGQRVALRTELKAILGQPGFGMGRSAEGREQIDDGEGSVPREAAEHFRKLCQHRVFRRKIGQRATRGFERRRNDYDKAFGLSKAGMDELFISATKFQRGAGGIEGFGPAELGEHDGRLEPRKLLDQGREADIARLSKNRVALPAAISKMNVGSGILQSEEGVEVAQFTGGGDVGSANPGDDIARAQLQSRPGRVSGSAQGNRYQDQKTNP